MIELINEFILAVGRDKIEIYNEFSVQHELGIYLRSCLDEEKVQFERNVSYFSFPKSNFEKKEIDISVFTPDKERLVSAIELKYPRNGQYPEQMFSFCKDIVFAEQLKTFGFEQAIVVIFADDHLFYKGSGEGIYGYFRKEKQLHGSIMKPTGKKDKELYIQGSYTIKWFPVAGQLWYTIIEV